MIQLNLDEREARLAYRAFANEATTARAMREECADELRALAHRVEAQLFRRWLWRRR